MSAKLLPHFLGKPKKGTLEPAYYTTTFSFTYGDAERFGCSRRNFPRVIADLMACGFIDPVEKGGLRGYGLSTSKFRLSLRWKRFGQSDFVNIRWQSFSTEGVHGQAPNCPPTRAKKALRGGAV